MHGCMCIFAESVECIQTGVFDHHACAGVYFKQVFDMNIHICVRTRCRVCTCAHVCAVCSFSVGGRGLGGTTSP